MIHDNVLCRVLLLEGVKELADLQALLQALRVHGVPLLQVGWAT